MEIKKAQRSKVKIRLALASPTGFGKTTGALMIAYGMTKNWDKIGVIDTENESASLYADHTYKSGFTVGEFNTIPLTPPFTPEKYIEAIKIMENSGMEVIIIDSITHVWNGAGGLLEFKDSLGGTFQNWAKVTPRYQAWLNAILQSKCHVITTNRKKQAYSIITENNKTKVEKAGMDDQIRDGYDYEMTIAFDITNDKFLAKTSKDRSGLFMDGPEFIITPEIGEKILTWCESGVTAKTKTKEDLIQEACFTLNLSTTKEELASNWKLIGREMQEIKDCMDLKETLKQKFETVKA
jgi:hypothetical protein